MLTTVNSIFTIPANKIHHRIQHFHLVRKKHSNLCQNHCRKRSSAELWSYGKLSILTGSNKTARNY